MTRNVKMEVSIWEIILAVKQRWKFVLLIMLICAALALAAGMVRGGGMQALQADGNGQQQDEQYQLDRKQYEDSAVLGSAANSKLQSEWLRLAKVVSEHPLMDVDPYNCSYTALNMRFEEGSGNHYGIVRSWLDTADQQKLFGEAYETLGEYRMDMLIIDGGFTMSNQDGYAETTVRVIETEGFDTAAAAEYLRDHFKKQAARDGITIEHLSVTHGNGEVYEVEDFQYNVGVQFNSVQSSIRNIGDRKIIFPEPSVGSLTRQDAIKSMLKYLIAGLLFGFIASAALVVFRILFHGRIVSRRQMEAAFGMECLGDCSADSAAALEALNANLDLMTGENSRIILLARDGGEETEAMIRQWNGSGEREFMAGMDITEDPATLEQLKSADGIVLGVRIGESRLEDVQRQVLRAERLTKPVLGFVLI